MKPSFWSRPFELSFKDVLATIFSSTFLFFSWKALGDHDALAVVQALVPLIGIILGGYFVQESAAIWLMRSQGMQQYPYYGSYNTYGYSTMPVTATTPAGTGQQAQTQGQVQAGQSKPTI